jgi:hypothetical protein
MFHSQNSGLRAFRKMPRFGVEAKERAMTTKADRSDLSRALAKAIAYRDCGNPGKAASWAAELVRMLEAQSILTAAALASRPL